MIFAWIISWFIWGDGTVSVSPSLGGWAVSLIVCAVADMVYLARNGELS